MIKNQKNHIQKGDVVKIISGGQKGLLGKIQTVLKKKSSVIVEGVLPRIKYLKNNREKQQEDSKKVELPILIHISNVMLWDKENNQVSRIGYKKIESNIENLKKENSISSITDKNLKNQQNEIKKRYFKKSGALIPVNNINEGKN